MDEEDLDESSCDHWDYDEDNLTCLDCGKDLSEDIMAKAYDDWKDRDYD